MLWNMGLKVIFLQIISSPNLITDHDIAEIKLNIKSNRFKNVESVTQSRLVSNILFCIFILKHDKFGTKVKLVDS